MGVVFEGTLLERTTTFCSPHSKDKPNLTVMRACPGQTTTFDPGKEWNGVEGHLLNIGKWLPR